jgi:hypothetical protein
VQVLNQRRNTGKVPITVQGNIRVMAKRKDARFDMNITPSDFVPLLRLLFALQLLSACGFGEFERLDVRRNDG